MKRKLRLCPEYFCYCLWEVFEDGGIENISANILSISENLKKEVNDWEDVYQSTYCDVDPRVSGFCTLQEEAAFWSKGVMLQQCLRNELGEGYELVACIRSHSGIR
ncbi:hypothetical protein LQR30_15235 [Chromobacterium piscinae]|uniref:hypothetical protein n=1 Tax=Chromobacterium piscinae TaxID=686831 RepID=UPI001E36F892|nr:hypothetical protein [Chromobacterium piscinae]MCD4505450.1 hypothetical protein [Chromobacterium piscinae]